MRADPFRHARAISYTIEIYNTFSTGANKIPKNLMPRTKIDEAVAHVERLQKHKSVGMLDAWTVRWGLDLLKRLRGDERLEVSEFAIRGNAYLPRTEVIYTKGSEIEVRRWDEKNTRWIGRKYGVPGVSCIVSGDKSRIGELLSSRYHGLKINLEYLSVVDVDGDKAKIQVQFEETSR